MNKLLCVRHGKTEWNELGLMQGSKDISLNQEGIEKAIKLSKGLDLSDIDLCMCSPMKRTVQTAQILLQDKIPIIYDYNLVERSFGELEGTKYDNSMMNRHWDYKINTDEYGIEPIQSCLKRAQDFIDYINKNYENKNILVISHGCFIKCLHYCINGYNENTNFMTFFPENVKVYEYIIEPNNKVYKQRKLI